MDTRNGNGKDLVEGAAETLALIDYLSGKQWQPVRNGEIAEALGWSPAKTTRMCKTLEAKGYMEQVDAGWRLGPKLVRLAVDFIEASRDQAREYLDIFHRFTGLSQNRF